VSTGLLVTVLPQWDSGTVHQSWVQSTVQQLGKPEGSTDLLVTELHS
jgi:hypothetical protein